MDSVNHVDEELLERYSLGRIEGDEAAPLEEHLLVCQECRDRLEGLNVYHRAMRSALQSIPCKSVVRVRSFT
jgi:anti-sigma factor RsiW